MCRERSAARRLTDRKSVRLRALSTGRGLVTVAARGGSRFNEPFRPDAFDVNAEVTCNGGELLQVPGMLQGSGECEGLWQPGRRNLVERANHFHRRLAARQSACRPILRDSAFWPTALRTAGQRVWR
jgi:hypothetical protein